MFQVSEVDKTYHQNSVLRGVSLVVQPKEVVGLLGINGAGKSTLFEILAGCEAPSGGEILWEGKQITTADASFRRKVGYLPQRLQFPPWSTPHELFSYSARLREKKNFKEEIAKVVQFWDCTDYLYRPLGSCSQGMRKRVGLALVMLADAPLLLLDEPFSGLDLKQVQKLRDFISMRREEGAAVLLSTHIAPYVAQMCLRAYALLDGVCQPIDGWDDSQARVDSIERVFA